MAHFDCHPEPAFFAQRGILVKVTGHVYSRGGSDAISLEHIEEVKE